ncbi:ATP synthase subunit b [Candidatus Protochlamydia amoebophila]|uniref:ATP synthase subunit b n=2 Tax=Candidatus Protochlamydia amoebophila TaxID=362787 RepID=A0A0C1JMG3_9BACT|nr:ATP synthase subunit b [Candidatus Protochlamydia amoebophila]
MMNFEIEQILTQIIAFLIMLGVLKKFVWKRLLNLIEERKQLIQSEFDKIENQKEEVTKLSEEYKAKLHDIDAEARRRIQEAVVKGRDIAHDIEQETRQKVTSLLNNAQEEMKLELAQAKEQLKKDVINISFAITEKLIQEKVDISKHQKLVEEAVEQVEIR